MNPPIERQQTPSLVQGEIHGMMPVQFTKIEDFTTMTVEFARVDNNIVVHFFLTDETLTERTGRPPQNETERSSWARHFVDNDSALSKYWKELFPALLEQAALAVFRVRPPRIEAAYTEELASWWFRAKGFNVLKPDMLVRDLVVQLDQALEAAGASSMLARKAT